MGLYDIKSTRVLHIWPMGSGTVGCVVTDGDTDRAIMLRILGDCEQQQACVWLLAASFLHLYPNWTYDIALLDKTWALLTWSLTCHQWGHYGPSGWWSWAASGRPVTTDHVYLALPELHNNPYWLSYGLKTDRNKAKYCFHNNQSVHCLYLIQRITSSDFLIWSFFNNSVKVICCSYTVIKLDLIGIWKLYLYTHLWIGLMLFRNRYIQLYVFRH